MKIFIFSSSSEPVGVAKNTLSLAKSLASRGHEVSLLALNCGWLTKECELAGIPVKAFKFSSVFKSVFFINFYLFFLLKNRSDVCLHLNGRATLFASALCLFFKHKIGYCYSVRQFLCVGDPGSFSWKERLETYLMGRPQVLLHAVSKSLADETRSRLLGNKEVEYIPNFLEVTGLADEDKNSDNRSGESFRFVYAGRLSVEKGVDILIESFQLLVSEWGEENPSVSLDIFGSGGQHDALV